MIVETETYRSGEKERGSSKYRGSRVVIDDKTAPYVYSKYTFCCDKTVKKSDEGYGEK